MKKRKEIVKMLEELNEHYTHNRHMVLYETTDISEYVVETEDDFELVTPETTINALKDLVDEIYNEYKWEDLDEDIEVTFDEVKEGIDSMFGYYQMLQGNLDENKDNRYGKRTVNIYNIQHFLRKIDNGTTAIKDLFKTIKEKEYDTEI